MIIGIDFDGTFARDPEIFSRLVTLFEAAGHRCVLVTGRSDEGAFGREVRQAVRERLPIVFAGREWKRHAALAAGWKVDIWIDDQPEYVGPQAPILTAEKV